MKQCPKHVGFFEGLSVEGNTVIGVKNRIACKSWECPVCGPRKLKHLRRRIFQGGIGRDALQPGFRGLYGQKFLTLTCPGREWRDSHSIGEAYEIMSKNFTKLMKALKYVHGSFYYFRVVEPQRDEYPHYHVLLVGNNIAKKTILNHLERLWREKYGMGFLRLNVVTKSIVHGVRYLTKYLTKSVGFKPPIAGMRLFTASRGSLERIEKREWIMKNITMGFCTRDDGEVREYDLTEEQAEEMMKIIQQDFFRYRGRTDDDIDSLELKVKQITEDEL